MTVNVNWPLVCVNALSLASYASTSVIAPFFPSEALKKGMSASLAGGVFSVFGFSLILMNALTGRFLPLVGSKIALTFGIIVVGLSNIVFGLLDLVNDSTIFIVFCFILRILEGIGAACICTTVYLILIKKCGDKLDKAIAINEACSSIGFTIGPPIGSLFYSIGGYMLPFIVLGAFVLVNIPFSLTLLENYKGFSVTEEPVEQEQKLTYLKLLSIPRVVLICVVVFAVGNNYGVIGATLELYLESYDIGPNFIGFMFMLMSGSFAISSIIVGRFLAQSNSYRKFAIGLLISGVAFLVIGPSPFFVLPGSSVLAAFSLSMIGIGHGLALIPSMPTIMQVTIDTGFPENVSNSSYVSGLWTTTMSTGLALGSYFGAALFEYFGSEIMFTTIALLNLVCSFISLQFMIDCFRKRETQDEARRDDYVEIEDSSPKDRTVITEKASPRRILVKAVNKS